MDKLKPCPNCENLKHPDFPCIRCYPLNPVFVRRPASNTNTDTALAAAEARIAELETEIAQWRDMGIRAVTGGRGVEGGDLIPNQIWPNGWQQDIAMVAYLIHCHEVRIAALEKALEPFAEEARKGLNFDSTCPVDLAQVFSITVGDLRRAAALLKEKE